MESLDVELRSSGATTIRSKLSDASTYILGHDGVVVPDRGTRPGGQLRFITENHQIYVAPSGPQQIMVNGKPVTDRAVVNNGDWVTVGGHVYQVKLSGAAGGHATAHAITDLTSPNTGGMGPTTSTTGLNKIIIGRHVDCTLSINSPLVSREHAKLVREGDHWALEDLGSTNGTFLNGNRIEGRVPLHPGDSVAFASFQYKFTGDALVAEASLHP
jgi:hypothetical protein